MQFKSFHYWVPNDRKARGEGWLGPNTNIDPHKNKLHNIFSGVSDKWEGITIWPKHLF